MKGSKHLGHAFPVSTEEEIKQHLDSLWKAHHTATHVCYAWRLGADKNRFRANDDGEPSGTAGLPILGQIKSFDLTNVLIAVVRYYGGTNLGTGGLIEAYGTASRMALEAAVIVEKTVTVSYSLSFTYADMPRVMRLLKDFDASVSNSSFEMQCSLLAAIRLDDALRFETAWKELRLDETSELKSE